VTRHAGFTAAAAGLVALLALPATRSLLEAHLVTLVFVQMLALAAAGFVAGAALQPALAARLQPWNRGGVPGVLLALATLAFWMLPRSMDASLTEPLYTAAKFLTLPLLLGLPLGLSWPTVHPLLCGFLRANLISMLAVLAWLYTVAPVRVCNNYLVDEQTALGEMFGLAAIILAVAWGAPLLGLSKPQRQRTSNQAPC
jgi:hypothetical protein